MKNRVTVLWKAATMSPWRASFRYRVALPAMYLEKLGARSRIGWHAKLMHLRAADAVVFAKTFHPGDLALARQAKARGIPVIYDLCDNIFVDGYPVHARIIFEQIARLASVIVTNTPALAEVVGRHVKGDVAVVAIPDAVERSADMLRIMRKVRLAHSFELLLHRVNAARVAARKNIRRVRDAAVHAKKRSRATMGRGVAHVILGLRRRLGHVKSRLVRPTQASESELVTLQSQRAAPIRLGSENTERVVTWFGNHGGEYADFGMLDILLAAQALEALARRFPLKLRVVSNNLSKYKTHISPLNLSSEYVPWTPTSARKAIENSDVVIVPSTLNEFTRCKSANRVLLALDCGVPVVATRTPATADLENCVIFDEWEKGIESYLLDGNLVRKHLQNAHEAIRDRYAPEVVAKRWLQILQNVKTDGPPIREAQTAQRLVLLIHLVQDLDLILPIYEQAKQWTLWHPEVWVTTYDLMRRPEMHRRLEAEGVPYQLVEPRYHTSGGIPEWTGVAAMLSASESTADPHRMAHEIVKLAQSRSVRTYTMQHGFENVGLTYGDERFPVDRVRFASDVVFIWGTLESLHEKVGYETRQKCFPVGCPKPIARPKRQLPQAFSKPIVAVFENLHSARYEDVYRHRFLEDLLATIAARPDLQFVIKPHPAGQYLTTRYPGKLELPANAVIADPRTREWAELSAADILAHATAVITSVTTVAFDAARAGKSLAVAGSGYARDLKRFRPLHILDRREDWIAFLERVVDDRDPGIRALSAALVERSAIEGDAIGRILARIAQDLPVRPGSVESRG